MWQVAQDAGSPGDAELVLVQQTGGVVQPVAPVVVDAAGAEGHLLPVGLADAGQAATGVVQPAVHQGGRIELRQGQVVAEVGENPERLGVLDGVGDGGLGGQSQGGGGGKSLPAHLTGEGHAGIHQDVA